MPTEQDANSLFNQINMAGTMEEEELKALGSSLVEQIEHDKDSRSEWEDNLDEALKLADQVAEEKNTPWPGAANVKYPLLSTAAVQFHARAHPSIINSRTPVLAKVEGQRTPEKQKRADRLTKFMSYQVMEQMDEWQDDTDRLLFILPIVGLMWRKLYWSPSLNRKVSMLASPRDVIINYHATDYVRARITHRLYMTDNEIIEHMRAGLFLEIPLHEEKDGKKLGGEPVEEYEGVRDEIHGLSNSSYDDPMATSEIYECHTFLDLDDDGYKEPYIVTLTTEGDVLRIVPRYYESDVERAADGQIIKIKPIQHFIPYKFMPDHESSVYGIGFGKLLGPNNEVVNTLINQLLDAGTLANRQGGFLGKGIRVKGGVVKFKPGQWQQVQNTGDDLRKNIFPLPVREPSSVLFQLLGMLIESSQSLSSVQDMMVGKNPGQNQPFATSQAVLEQGLKVFNGIYKRIYRSLTKEFKFLAELNYAYPEDEFYREVVDDPQAAMMMDFDKSDYNVCPSAEPDMVAESQRIMKGQALVQHMAQGMPLNVQEVTKRVLEMEGHDDIDLLMQTPPPQPDFETQLEMQKFQHERQKDMQEMEIDRIRVMSEARKDMMQALKLYMQSREIEDKGVIEEARLIQQATSEAAKRDLERLKLLTDMMQMRQNTDKTGEQQNERTAGNRGEGVQGSGGTPNGGNA